MKVRREKNTTQENNKVRKSDERWREGSREWWGNGAKRIVLINFLKTLFVISLVIVCRCWRRSASMKGECVVCKGNVRIPFGDIVDFVHRITGDYCRYCLCENFSCSLVTAKCNVDGTQFVPIITSIAVFSIPMLPWNMLDVSEESLLSPIRSKLIQLFSHHRKQ